MINVILIGNSGHAKVIKDIVNTNKGYEVYATLDDKYSDRFLENGIVKAPTKDIKQILADYPYAKLVIAIGANNIRKKLISELGLDDSRYESFIHPSAIISPDVQIGKGTVVMPNVTINAGTKIGNHVIINTNSVVEHDCTINDFAHISPSTTLTGGVVIGQGTHIGANATVIPTKEIGDWVTVGAGSVVTTDIPANVTVVGVPAKVIKE